MLFRVTQEGKWYRRKSDGVETPLASAAGKFWWVEVDRGASRGTILTSPPQVAAWGEGEHQTMSTEEIAAALDEGFEVIAYGGPFATRDEASRRLDNYWDAVMGDDDDD